MKHLQISQHQPSPTVKDKRKLFIDFRQCYTCKMCFDGYIRLMNHRKKTHPSTKKCKNFSSGKCPYNSECWYVHDEENSDEMNDNFNCTLCEQQIKGRHSFMIHKKNNHVEATPKCREFLEGKCNRSSEGCWFVHSNDNKSEASVFHQTHQKTFPPDHIQKIVEMLNQVNLKVDHLQQQISQKNA